VSDQQIQKVKVKRLVHVGLWVADVPAQARFYHQILGLNLRLDTADTNDGLDDNESSLFLTLDETTHCLGLFEDTRPVIQKGRKPVQYSPLHHLAFGVDTDAELAALAARLQMAGVELSFEPRDGDPDQGDTLWFHDPDGNRVEILVTANELLTPPHATRKAHLLRRPLALQHVALQTERLEEMVEFYTEALGFDISDWLLRECAWLRCNSNHHSLVLLQGKTGIDHVGYAIANGTELLHWADHLSQQQVPILWGPGRHGAGEDLFVRFADVEGIQVELSAELQQYHDRDVTIPPRLWHTRSAAWNLWGILPPWMREETPV